MTFKGATAQQHSPKRQASLSVMVGRLLVAMMALCLTAQLSPARADYGECERSYQLGRKDEAIRLCRRAAWQDNDFFAQVKLGDIYSAKREDDKGYYDPVEAYVWYFLATKNSSIFDHFHLDPAADFVVTRLANAATDADAIYRNLLQEERIDVRNRITYIQSCRGGDGFIALGQLQDPFIIQKHQGSTGPLAGITSAWFARRFIGKGQGTRLAPISQPPYSPSTGGSSSSAYPSGSSSYKTGIDFWGNKLCNSSDWFGWLVPSSCSRYTNGLDGSTTVFQPSPMEAMVAYMLAEREGHPIAKSYIDALKFWQGDFTPVDPKTQGRDILARAKAKAYRWMSPYEFYAAESRYRGETPSGLVHSDECPINQKRQIALAQADRLVPVVLRRDMLKFLGLYRDGSRDTTRSIDAGPQEFQRAAAKYQDMLGDPQTGVLTSVQLTRLIQIVAVRGSARAQRCLGIMYVKGIGVPENFVRAEKWLLASAEQGDGEAMYALSELYTQGADGVDKSEDKSVRYRQGSAAAGFEPTRAEFLRILETAPSPRNECNTRRCRRDRERAAQEAAANAAAQDGQPIN